MSMGRIGGAIVAVCMCLGGSAAQAQIFNLPGSPAGRWFAEGELGVSWGDVDGFRIAGVPTSDNSTDTSFTAGAGFGFFFTNQVFARFTYNYFGSFDIGSIGSGAGAQMEATAHGFMIGLGFNYDLSRELFLEATGDIGLSLINTSAHDMTGFSRSFKSEANFAAGFGLGLGYRLSSTTDIVVKGNYYWLGDALPSGTTDFDAGSLNVVTTTVGVRFKF